MRKINAFLALAFFITLAYYAFNIAPAPYPQPPTLFEDGSFVLWKITGCIPWMLCH